jgi:hypothetical protein
MVFRLFFSKILHNHQFWQQKEEIGKEKSQPSQEDVLFCVMKIITILFGELKIIFFQLQIKKEIK